jgi:hypothetical protein
LQDRHSFTDDKLPTALQMIDTNPPLMVLEVLFFEIVSKISTKSGLRIQMDVPQF